MLTWSEVYDHVTVATEDVKPIIEYYTIKPDLPDHAIDYLNSFTV